MSAPLEGDQQTHQAEQQRTVTLQQRSRAEQQAWLDEQCLRRKISIMEWRFQFDILSLLNADGSYPDIEA